MKRIAVFITLKILEIASPIFVPYGIGRAVKWCLPNLGWRAGYGWMWLEGLTCTVIAAIALMAAFLFIDCAIWPFIKLNWHWATKLTEEK